MITDPKTIPSTPRMRILYAVSVGLLACILIAPARTEFWSKVAVLGSLTRRLRRLAAAEALLAAADGHAHPDRPRRRRRARSVRRCARLRRDPRPQLRDRRTARVHRPAAGDHDRHVAGRPEQAPRENRAPDRRRPGRRSRAPGARARAPGRQGTCTRGHFRSPARVATAAPGRTWPPHSRPRVPPRPDGRPLRGGQRPGRGDRRGEPGRHTSADDVLRDPRDRPAPRGADRLPRDARAPERRRPLAGRARPAPGRRERPLACRRPGGRRGLRRRPPHRCRAEGRPRTSARAPSATESPRTRRR